MSIIQKYTIRMLKRNKTRTIVTIIGIILSLSMFTGVTSIASSLQNYMIKYMIETKGNWHGKAFSVSNEEFKDLWKEEKIKTYFYNQNIGYSKLENSDNEYIPYLFVMGVDNAFIENMPVYMIDGRLPESTDEIILPKHLQTSGKIQYKIGDKIDLKIGDRFIDGEILNQNIMLTRDENAEDKKVLEQFIVRTNKEYTVVGIYERPKFESFSSPGFTSITLIDESQIDNYDVHIQMNKPKSIYDFLNDKFNNYETSVNKDLLRVMNSSKNNSLNKMIYSLSGILIFIISLGSISLIYNAFSISISERTKQFGLLTSIGATKRQILNSVLFEAISLSLIGIPLGVLAGVFGISVTLRVTENLFSKVLDFSNKTSLSLYVSPTAILVAVIAGLITVLISAYIPARRASRVPPIVAIRQTSEIKSDVKKIKTSKLSYYLFGFEGLIASKNFKRSKKKYRTTVVSLFMSTILFISASSFCAYLIKGSTSISRDTGYDIRYYYRNIETEEMPLEEVYALLKDAESVTGGFYSRSIYMKGRVSAINVNPDVIDYYNEVLNDGNNYIDKTSGTIDYALNLNFIDDESFIQYLKENHYNVNEFMDSENPKAIVCNSLMVYGRNNQYKLYNILNNENAQISILRAKNFEDLEWLSGYDSDEYGNIILRYLDEEGNTIDKLEEEAVDFFNLKIGAITDAKIFGAGENYDKNLSLILPMSAIDTVVGKNNKDISSDHHESWYMFFNTDDHKKAYDSMYKILDDNNLSTNGLNDLLYSAESDRAVIAIIRIFSYGFIILISLIASANVFNTISTNINLRRREFAMLKSIGMSQKGFQRMMNYECILFGMKGLLYGIPVSIFITYLIYKGMGHGIDIGFFIPWIDVVIAILSVFIVIFFTMLYSTRILNKENTMDALRNENI